MATLYATSPASLVSITDPTGQGSLTATPRLLATAATNEAFRGVAFAPSAPSSTLPESPLAVGLPPTALVLAGTATVVLRRRRTLSA